MNQYTGFVYSDWDRAYCVYDHTQKRIVSKHRDQASAANACSSLNSTSCEPLRYRVHRSTRFQPLVRQVWRDRPWSSNPALIDANFVNRITKALG